MREYPVACPRWSGPEVYLGGLSMLYTGLSDFGSKRYTASSFHMSCQRFSIEAESYCAMANAC